MYNYLTPQTRYKLGLLNERCKTHANAPEKIGTEERLDLQLMFASCLPNFVEFAELGMLYLGFSLSEIQADIANYMQYGARKRMAQAQRSQAKSTIAALYSVWRLIQNPQNRVLVVSAGADLASDIARIPMRLIQQWPLLCWMRPDPRLGDRISFEDFDVHSSLRNVDKTASISCVGITANLPGKRADVLIADDIESPKNSYTQAMREKLILQTKEFSAICTYGDIIYLGTPQSKDSVYRTLPNRGFEIRIWPSRYPTPEELTRYAPDTLAPIVLKGIEEHPEWQTGGGLTGTRGQPIDTVVMPEHVLQEKELDYGDEGYALQYMLDTTLSDAARTKIKLSDLIVVDYGLDFAPEIVLWSAEPRFAFKNINPAISLEQMYMPSSSSSEFTKYHQKVMVIDPAGSGGDEVAFCIGGVAGNYIHLFSTGGLKNGMSLENIQTLLDLCKEYEVANIRVEKNMGHGTVAALIISEIRNQGLSISVQEYYSKGQKERRIIDTISPVTRRHRLLVHRRALEDDWRYCLQHSPEKRNQFSLFRQLADISYERNSLNHDDRADCLQAMVEYFVAYLSLDGEAEKEKRKHEEMMDFIRYPLGKEFSNSPKIVRKSTRGKLVRY